MADSDYGPDLVRRGEFRWSKRSQRSRDAYFESLAQILPRHHAVVWDKEALRSVDSSPGLVEIGMMREAIELLGGMSFKGG
jgi:hypothetical protein